MDGTCPGQCPGHVQDIEIFLGHCPIPALVKGKLNGTTCCPSSCDDAFGAAGIFNISLCTIAGARHVGQRKSNGRDIELNSPDEYPSTNKEVLKHEA